MALEKKANNCNLNLHTTSGPRRVEAVMRFYLVLSLRVFFLDRFISQWNLFIHFVFLRQGFTIYFMMALNSQQSPCLPSKFWDYRVPPRPLSHIKTINMSAFNSCITAFLSHGEGLFIFQFSASP